MHAMMNLAAQFVSLLHVLLILFVASVPFLALEFPWYMLHLTVVLGLVVHWALRTDVCALTYIEASLRGMPPDKSFIYSIVGPVFNIEDSTLRKFVFTSTILLGFLSAYRVTKKLNGRQW
jgi:uncharacterized protein DUF2784